MAAMQWAEDELARIEGMRSPIAGWASRRLSLSQEELLAELTHPDWEKAEGDPED